MRKPLDAKQSRVLALLLLIAAVAGAYFFAVHWWFTAPLLEARADLIRLRDQELQLRTAAQQRSLIEQRLAEVREFESANPEFLPETNFDLASAALVQRLQSLVDAQGAGSSCSLVSRTPYRMQTEEPFQRVTIKVRMRCEVEPFAAILHGLETSSPQLFITDLNITSQRQYMTPTVNTPNPTGWIDFSFDVYGYLRQPGGSDA